MLYIFQLINYETGEVIPYEPHLAPQVAEITNAESRAAEAARLAQCLQRLTGLQLPRTRPLTDPDPIDATARQLFISRAE